MWGLWENLFVIQFWLLFQWYMQIIFASNRITFLTFIYPIYVLLNLWVCLRNFKIKIYQSKIKNFLIQFTTFIYLKNWSWNCFSVWFTKDNISLEILFKTQAFLVSYNIEAFVNLLSVACIELLKLFYKKQDFFSLFDWNFYTNCIMKKNWNNNKLLLG